MTTSLRLTAASVVACLSLLAPLVSRADPVITNGGFENFFAGWSLANQTGGDGSFSIQTGTTSPSGNFSVAAPPEGTQAAMSDTEGPGAHVLYQDFVASGNNVLLKFDLFLQSVYGQPFLASPDTLDFSIAQFNQQARVDILIDGADAFSVDSTDVLLNLYQSNPGDIFDTGYVSVSADLSSLMTTYAGQTLRLRFAETDNMAEFQMGVDNVRFESSANPVPEPAGWALAGLGLAALALTGRRRRGLAALSAATCLAGPALADTSPPTLLDPNLQVTTVLSSGITQPIGIAFIGPNDFLLLEKASGLVKRVINGVVQPNPVLDLAVNSSSERGLLSLVLHPLFPANQSVFIFWTESSTGADSTVLTEVPQRGNRVDRFIWNGSTLTQAENLIKLRSLQTDNLTVPGQDPSTANAEPRGNQNGGTMRFGLDGKLYVFAGDQGRRGWMQNLANGPFLTGQHLDDTFGGPATDNLHLSGVVLRLNSDGTTPADNPFFAAGAAIGGEVGANIQKIYSYGHRNGFGMAVDNITGNLWLTENADDVYSEINRLIPGMNGGWIQFAGPISRVRDWRTIEASQFGKDLQQRRYPPTRAAYTSDAAQARLFMLPGATYKDPELSARYEIGPSGAAFVYRGALGPAYESTFWFGSSRSNVQVGGNGGSLYRLKLTADRLHIDTSDDPRLADKVIDNLFSPLKFEGSETESLKVGSFFGTVAAIEEGPDGNLYVVSLTDNAVYRISRTPPP